jgi:tetratricopeptide (TPR) repeat protein
VSFFLKYNYDHLKVLPLINALFEPLLHWSNCDYEKAEAGFDQYLVQYPCDVVVLFMRHMLDFCCGKTCKLQNKIQETDKQLSEDHPLYGYYLGIKSFVLCESGKYLESLEIGLKGYNILQNNVYAIHAVAHAYHEMAEYQKTIDFLYKTKDNWIDNFGMKMHIYWHIGVAELGLSCFEKANQSFSEFFSMKFSSIAEQDLDAVGFLWRYRLSKPEDDRYEQLWNQLSENWIGCIGSSISYFHDLHAALCFAATKKSFLIRKMIVCRDGTGTPYNSHEVGIPILEAIYDYSIGQYDNCSSKLNKTKNRWARIGGSHAQREILYLTLQNAINRNKAKK